MNEEQLRAEARAELRRQIRSMLWHFFWHWVFWLSVAIGSALAFDALTKAL